MSGAFIHSVVVGSQTNHTPMSNISRGDVVIIIIFIIIIMSLSFRQTDNSRFALFSLCSRDVREFRHMMRAAYMQNCAQPQINCRSSSEHIYFFDTHHRAPFVHEMYGIYNGVCVRKVIWNLSGGGRGGLEMQRTITEPTRRPHDIMQNSTTSYAVRLLLLLVYCHPLLSVSHMGNDKLRHIMYREDNM